MTDEHDLQASAVNPTAPSITKRLAAAEAKLEHRKIKINELAGELREARQQLAAFERQAHQYRAVVQRLLPLGAWLKELPPEHLRLNVGAVTTEANFLQQGNLSSARVVREFDPVIGPMLDWGCGSGRTLNWLLKDPAWREAYYGCDVDAEAIAWLKSLGVRAEVCKDDPPLPYPDGFFAGIFSFSVLTHIPPQKHRAWYAEFHRLLMPGGRVLCTTCGDHTLAIDTARLDHLRSTIDEHGFAFSEAEGHYKHVAIASQEYSRRAFEGLLEEVSYGHYSNMDAFVLRKAK